MRRIGMLALIVLVVAGCKTLPWPAEMEPAQTHIQELKFDKPDDGNIQAHAELVIYNPGHVKTRVDGVEATLYRGEAALGRAVRDSDHEVSPLSSQRVQLHFKHISVEQLEAAIGRRLEDRGAESFEIEGVIIYETQEGPMRQAFSRFRIQAVLGPKGSRL